MVLCGVTKFVLLQFEFFPSCRLSCLGGNVRPGVKEEGSGVEVGTGNMFIEPECAIDTGDDVDPSSRRELQCFQYPAVVAIHGLANILESSFDCQNDQGGYLMPKT